MNPSSRALPLAFLALVGGSLLADPPPAEPEPPRSPAAVAMLGALPGQWRGWLYVDLEAVRRDLPKALDAPSVRCQFAALEALGVPVFTPAVARLALGYQPGLGAFPRATGVAEGPGLVAAFQARQHGAWDVKGPAGRLLAAPTGTDRLVFSFAAEGEPVGLPPEGARRDDLPEGLGRADCWLQLRMEFEPPPPQPSPAPAGAAPQVWVREQDYDLIRTPALVQGRMQIRTSLGAFDGFMAALMPLAVGPAKANLDRIRDRMAPGPARDLLGKAVVEPGGGGLVVTFSVTRDEFAASAGDLIPWVTGTLHCGEPVAATAPAGPRTLGSWLF